tara:strand:- start:297 stop:440 length:144 start_codon:yes stop_codon:yes gene_type:complete
MNNSITICVSCWEHWEQRNKTVWWIDDNDCCEDENCEVYITKGGGNI